MMSPETKEVVPCFESIEALQEGLAAKRAFEAIDLYPRDGSLLLCETEARVAELARVDAHEAIIFNSGMAAVSDAIQVGLDLSRKPAPTLAISQQLYSQSLNLGQIIQRRGVKTIFFDSGSPDAVAGVIDARQPDVIFSETVANGPDMPILDVGSLLRKTRELDSSPVVILDNTLPLSTGLPLGEELKSEDNVIVVESGTKSYTFNQELLGITYSKTPVLLDGLKQHRRTVGSMPGLGSVERIRALLPETRESFDERNLSLFKNSGKLALKLYEAQSKGADFIVSHPLLPTHDNHDLALALPDGGSPVLFLQCTSCADQFDLAKRLGEDLEVKEQARLGQSFGFDTARILPDERAKVVRISAGARTDADALGTALAKAAIRG